MMLFRAGNNGASVTLARRIGKRWQLWQRNAGKPFRVSLILIWVSG